MDLNSPLSELYKGKIPKSIQLLKEHGIEYINDVLLILPNKVLTFPKIQSLKEAKTGQPFSGKGLIEKIIKRPNFSKKGRLFNVTALVLDFNSDEKINLIWFNTYPNFLNKLENLKEIEYFGIVSEWKNKKQIVAPKLAINNQENTLIEYPTINTVSGNYIKKIIEKIPTYLWDDLIEKIPIEIIKKRNLTGIKECLKIIHGKINGDFNSAKERLIYEEFFQEQLKIYARKQKLLDRPSIKIPINNKTFELTKKFPYDLTECQKRSIHEILNDLASTKPMMRLLQGDVGCGKTTVAFISLLATFEEGFQGAFMCPTESLAYQHYFNFSKLFPDYPCKILLGSTKESEKNEIRNLLYQGQIKIIFGTHSLISNYVKFLNLGLIIIDEQHKFGVKQRLELLRRYPKSNTLIMSATPIPRSLSLTKYGDLSLSRINHFPAGEKKIKTKIVKRNNFGSFLNFLNTRIAMGEQAYLVVPAIHESERSIYLENLLAKFKKWFPNYSISAIHGQVPFEERTKILNDFLEQKVSILIATSVIEVGIDVKNATIMAIFSPELFGLSSLHQLRGRVGRGTKASFCFLMALKEVSNEAFERLKIIENSLDGFEISEKDLELRGEGEKFGTNQSGNESFRRLGDLSIHEHILMKAKEDLDFLIENENLMILSDIKRLENEINILSTI